MSCTCLNLMLIYTWSEPLLIKLSVNKMCDCVYLFLPGKPVKSQVAASFSCPRRSVLDERLKCSEQSIAALLGTLLHQIFQVTRLENNSLVNIVLSFRLLLFYTCSAQRIMSPYHCFYRLDL